MIKNTSILFLAALLFLTGCTSVKHVSRRSDAQKEDLNVKLPFDVVPIKYDISVWTNPSSERYSGNVAIEISLLKARSDVLLHAKDLEIISVNLAGAHGDNEAKFVQVDDEGLARIDFGEILPEGHYRLEIAYRAKYRDDLSGLYRVKESNDFYLYTQFEPISARKMVPCFDEPRFKTPFDVKVISPKGLAVIGNTPVRTVIPQGDDEIHVFETTKPLPTYLVALAVGPFDVVDGPALSQNRYRDQEIKLRGIAVKGKGSKLEFALKETPDIVKRLEQYFGVPYPYEKLDILAVPDFSAGAMENAGAITFREWYLLLDEKNASIDQRRGFYLVMAHELAHQWFGNSVTMPWWDDLWLNEAFATWLSYKIIDAMKPEYKSTERLVERSHEAMAQDSLVSARKIREPIKSNHDIHNAFDSITYSKGGAVLSMLENYLGPAHFRDAVSSHVKRFENKNATSRDFLESLAKFSDSSLTNSAETFLNQSGVPRVAVNYSCENKNGFRLSVEQSRYTPVGRKITLAGKWDIPMCVSFDAGGVVKKHCFTLSESAKKIDIPSNHCPSFVMPNAYGQGYYRFSLNLEAWKNLLGTKPGLLSESDKLAIADSMIAELYAGGLDFAFVAEGLRSMVSVNSLGLTRYFVKLMEETNNFWVSEENRALSLDFAHASLKDIYRSLSSSHELTADQLSLKKEIASFLARVVKDKEVRLELSVLGSSYLKKLDESEEGSCMIESADEEILSDAIAISLQYQNDLALEKASRKLSTITDTVQRRHLLFGLAKSREGKEANKIRSLVFDNNLRRNEQMRLLYDHLENPRNQPDTWEFLKANLSEFKKTLSNGQMANLPYLAEGLCEAGAVEEVNQFFSPFIAQYDGGPRNLAEVMEQIEICAARKNHAALLANRFFEGVKEQAVVEREKSAP